MARVKRAVHSRKHRRSVLEAAQGYYGNKSRSYRAAHEQVMHSLQYAYRDRRARKNDFRRLWVQLKALLESLLSTRIILFSIQRCAQLDVRTRPLGIELNRLLEGVLGVLPFFLLIISRSQHGVGLRELIVKLDGFLEVADPAFEILAQQRLLA